MTDDEYNERQVILVSFFELNKDRTLMWALTNLTQRGFKMREIRQAYIKWVEKTLDNHDE